MFRTRLIPAVAGLAALLDAVAATAATRTIRGTVPDDVIMADERIDVRADVGGDTVVAGRTIDIGGRIGDTLIAAGRRLTIGSGVRNDAILVGETVRIGGAVGDNLFAAGRSVAVDGRVSGKAIAAGGRVSLGPRATVADARLAGRTLIVAGTVARSARLAGDEVQIDGTVRGDVNVEADRLRLGRTARIAGRLTVESPRAPDVEPGAVVAGGISHRQPEEARRGAAAQVAARLVSALVMLIGLWLLGAVMLLLAPNFVRDVGRSLTRRPLPSLGVGLLIAIAGLPLALLLALTVIGLPLAFGVLSAYFFALGTAVPLFGLAIGRAWAVRDTGLEPRRSTVLARLAAVLLIVVLLGTLPFGGSLVWIGTGLLGMGAAGLALFERWRSGRGGPAALPPAGAAPAQ